MAEERQRGGAYHRSKADEVDALIADKAHEALQEDDRDEGTDGDASERVRVVEHREPVEIRRTWRRGRGRGRGEVDEEEEEKGEVK